MHGPVVLRQVVAVGAQTACEGVETLLVGLVGVAFTLLLDAQHGELRRVVDAVHRVGHEPHQHDEQ